MFMFRKAFLTLVLIVFAGSVSGCAVGAAISYGMVAAEVDNFNGAIEVSDIKTSSSVNVALIKRAAVSSVVFNKNMTMPNVTPSPSDVKVNVVVAEEAKRALGAFSNSSSVVVRVKTFYFDEGYPWGYYYWGSVTEKDTLSYYQKTSVRKAVNVHLTVEQGSNVLLEVHGLWGGNDQADEIAGARQLAKEMASAVLKKLNSPASRSAAAEAKKD